MQRAGDKQAHGAGIVRTSRHRIAQDRIEFAGAGLSRSRPPAQNLDPDQGKKRDRQVAAICRGGIGAGENCPLLPFGT